MSEWRNKRQLVFCSDIGLELNVRTLNNTSNKEWSLHSEQSSKTDLSVLTDCPACRSFCLSVLIVYVHRNPLSVMLQGDSVEVSIAKTIKTCWTVQRAPGEKVTHNYISSVTEDKHTHSDSKVYGQITSHTNSAFKTSGQRYKFQERPLLKSKKFNEEQKRGEKKTKTADGGQMGRVLMII